MPYYAREQDWGPAPSAPVSDTLDVNATNIATATVNAPRAQLDCGRQIVLNVKSDGPLNLTIDCSGSRGAAERCFSPRKAGSSELS